MKNPFIKENNGSVIALSLIGSIAAGAVAYLFLTEGGASLLGRAKKKVKTKAKDKAAGIVHRKTGLPKKAVKAAANLVVK